MPERAHYRRRQRANSALEDNGVVRSMRWSFGIMSAYLATTLLPLLRWALPKHAWFQLGVHVVLLVAAVLLAAKRRIPSVRLWFDWLPLVSGAFLYEELPSLIQGAARPYFDERVVHWEERFFPGNPSATLAMRFHNVALSEVLHFCYLSYYAIIFVPPIILWMRGKRAAFAATTLALVVVYTACFVTYIVFPVIGPRFVHGGSGAPGGLVRSVVLALLEAASSRGTAFPSSHVAAALVAASCALRFQWKTAIPIGFLTIGVGAGAVYGGYHYGVDIVAGVVFGLGAIIAARLIEPGKILLLRRDDPRHVKYAVVQERLERRKTAVKDRQREWRNR